MLKKKEIMHTNENFMKFKATASARRLEGGVLKFIYSLMLI